MLGKRKLRLISKNNTYITAKCDQIIFQPISLIYVKSRTLGRSMCASMPFVELSRGNSLIVVTAPRKIAQSARCFPR